MLQEWPVVRSGIVQTGMRPGPAHVASGGGSVREAGLDPQYGEFVLLEHPEGYQTMYGHLSRVVVRRGERVEPGGVLGVSGSSGRSSAPHLHFEIRQGGRSLDPLTMIHEESR